VAPLEVEEVLLGHPAVEQAYVIGLPDRRREEILAAVVVLKEGEDVTPEALRAFCKQALAAFKVPQELRILERRELPVTGTGKVQKFRLVEMLAPPSPQS
jgi:fatty-acyl-CoA synthase